MKTNIYDLAIIGAGPAGLSASICASSEGVRTVLLDINHIGGQAGSASLIENLIGFPEGITGQDLNLRSREQAIKFGVDIKTFDVRDIQKEGDLFHIMDDTQDWIHSKSVLITTGSSYTKLNLENIDEFVNKGITYGSPDINKNYDGKNIIIVGGANSAGQAAAFLSQCKDCNVYLVVRGDSIYDKMSTYLCTKVEGLPVNTLCNSEIVELKRATFTKRIITTIKSNDFELTVPADEIFLLIGTEPNTSRFKHLVELNELGFIRTGATKEDSLVMETSMTGIFAAGDCRLGSVKRVVSAIGEGGRAINDIKSYLSKLNRNG